jgi:hypothetical protein
VGVAVGTAAGIRDSVLMVFRLFSDPLFGRHVNTSIWRRCDGTSSPGCNPRKSCRFPRIPCTPQVIAALANYHDINILQKPRPGKPQVACTLARRHGLPDPCSAQGRTLTNGAATREFQWKPRRPETHRTVTYCNAHISSHPVQLRTCETSGTLGSRQRRGRPTLPPAPQRGPQPGSRTWQRERPTWLNGRRVSDHLPR